MNNTAHARQENETQDLRKQAGLWLRQQREKSGLSQTELAERVGVEYYSFISQIENGRGRIPSTRYAQWADALQMNRKTFVYQILRYYDPATFALLFEDETE